MTTIENKASFFERLTPFMPPSELSKVKTAYMLAKFAHRAQTRTQIDEKGNHIRYFEHCRNVALILIDEAKVRDWKLICAALLHDSLEDTEDITPEILEDIFGTRVCQIVKLLSKVPKEGYYERLKNFGDAEILLVKAADRLHNLRSMEGCQPDWVRVQVLETKSVLLPIFDGFRWAEHGQLLIPIVEKIRIVLAEHSGLLEIPK